jgi:hypothetical protein
MKQDMNITSFNKKIKLDHYEIDVSEIYQQFDPDTEKEILRIALFNHLIFQIHQSPQNSQSICKCLLHCHVSPDYLLFI